MKIIAYILAGIGTLLFGFLVMIAIFRPTMLGDARRLLAGYVKNSPRSYIVLSGSMEPNVKVGSVVLTRAQNENYGVGDIITFTRGGNADDVVTHRIVGVTNYKDPEYVVKGDANQTADIDTVINSEILGKVVTTIPYVGYIADFTKRPQGLILFVIIPLTIIIYEELKNIKKEAKKLLKKRHTNNAAITHRGFNKGFVLVPVLGSMLVFVGLTASFFNEHEESSANSFTAAMFAQNTPPQVSAGPDQSFNLPSTALLAGTVTDDGLPVPPGATTFLWTQQPPLLPLATFSSNTSLTPTVTFPSAGTYTFRLTATDDNLVTTVFDEVVITVGSDPNAPVNQPPTVNAGIDQPFSSTTYPFAVTLNGSVTDDGLPVPPGSTTQLWLQTSPVLSPLATFVPSSDNTQQIAHITIPSPGTYVFRLTATDNNNLLTGPFDEVTITVTDPTPPPITVTTVSRPLNGFFTGYSCNTNPCTLVTLTVNGTNFTSAIKAEAKMTIAPNTVTQGTVVFISPTQINVIFSTLGGNALTKSRIYDLRLYFALPDTREVTKTNAFNTNVP